jgi:rubrerythrin
MEKKCVHSCKGLCDALEVAEQRERQTIKEYQQYAADCDYPDVRALLQTLITHREQGLRLLLEAKDGLSVKFNTLDSIRDSFA